jgi:UDP-galactopyranose mutase
MNQSLISSDALLSHPDLLCLSHLRWNWVFQRPQHLMLRAAKNRRVFVFEEPVRSDGSLTRLALTYPHPNVTVATPHIPHEPGQPLRDATVKKLLDDLIRIQGLTDYVLWYYTPMALSFSRHLRPAAIVYDCMDQLSAFAGAPPELADLERQLLARCDAVFTGGLSLFEAKQGLHANVHCFPSSVDVQHFSRARGWLQEPDDQAKVPRPRLGYFGVIDERIDLDLIAAVAKARPAWQLILVGPVTKIDERTLPRSSNIHYLGAKSYDDLPGYVSGWDVALMPFARNPATRYISPTKTPEYLAAGKPVVSTSIRDVVRTYAGCGCVRIADEPAAFVAAVEQCFLEDPLSRLRQADLLLAQHSWDDTWRRMHTILEGVHVPAAVRSSCLTT